MLNVEYVAEFLVLAETLSYAETARRLHLSQSSVSRHIDAMERSLGAKLFERTTRKVELTDIGRELVGDFREIDARYRSVLKRVARDAAPSRVRVSCPEFWLEPYIEPLLAFAKGKAPLLDVELESNPPILGLDLVNEGLRDLAFGVALPSQLESSVSMRPFVSEEAVVVVHRDSPLAACEAIDAGELEKAPLVLLDDGADGFSRINKDLLEALAAMGVHPCDLRYARQVETLSVELDACKGLAVLPRSIQSVQRSYLVSRPFAGESPIVPFCFYYRADRLNAAIVQFLELAGAFASRLRSE